MQGAVGDSVRERTRVDSFHSANFEPVSAACLEVMQGHVQRLHDHGKILSMWNGVVVDVVVPLVDDALGMIQRLVDPVKSHAVRRQHSSSKLYGCRKISTSCLTNC